MKTAILISLVLLVVSTTLIYLGLRPRRTHQEKIKELYEFGKVSDRRQYQRRC